MKTEVLYAIMYFFLSANIYRKTKLKQTYPNLINKIMPEINVFFDKLSNNHPFISICQYNNQDYVGIIQNRDDAVTTIYDYGAIFDDALKSKFLELGDIWWWESNRLIPINLFLKDEWAVFKPYIKTFSNKGLLIIHGPVCSMNELHKRRSKRRSITLVKRIP